MKTIICALFLFFSFSAFAQYPFEKYPAIKFIKIPFKISKYQNGEPVVATAIYKDYKIELRAPRSSDGSDYLIYLKNKLIKASKIKFGFWVENLEDLDVGDIDGNGYFDFKIRFVNRQAGGLGSSLNGNVYFFNNGKNEFKKIFFADFYQFENKEFDFNRDDKYEIISGSYLSHKDRAYWVIDVYNYKDGKLLNVGQEYGYPMIYKFFEEKETYQMTKKIARKDMKNFERQLPEFYEEDK